MRKRAYYDIRRLNSSLGNQNTNNIQNTNNVQIIDILKNKKTPFVDYKINILLRVSYRPNYFSVWIKSVLEQKYKNFNIICCYDDINSKEYLDKVQDERFSYFYIENASKEHYKYNLYMNDLLERVQDGWIIFLDDDDQFSDDLSLAKINNLLNYTDDINKILFWKVKMTKDKILDIPENDKITYGKITSCQFCFHSKYKNFSHWVDKKGSDYHFLSKLLKNTNLKLYGFKEILTQTQHLNFGNNGLQEIDNLNYYLNFYKIKNIHISISLEHFNRIKNIHSLNEYDKNKPCLFFGIYNNFDINLINNHNHFKLIICGGSEVSNASRINKENCLFLSISKNMEERLNKINTKSNLINFSLLDKDLFKPVDTPGTKIFIYDGYKKNNDLIYNNDMIHKVKKILPDYEYIHSSTLNLPYEKMPDIYKECFIGLRLTHNDGNANMVQEMEAMNIPVVHNHSDYGLKWNNEEDIVGHIKSKEDIVERINNNKDNIFKIKNKKICIHSHTNLNYIAGDTIMLINFIKILQKNNNITLITQYNTTNIKKNIKENINIIQTENILNKINNISDTFDVIIIRNPYLLNKLSDKYLHKTIIYALDIDLDNIKMLKNNFLQIITQSNKLKQLFIDNGVDKNKIKIHEPIAFKYNFEIPKRDDNVIRLIYCGTLRDHENILEIIEEFKKIHRERPKVVLKIVYGKIHGDPVFREKINKYIKNGVKGITFKHNLSHRDACYEIATSDIGICWRKPGWGDNGEISTKVKEYKLYGLKICNIMNYEEIIILFLTNILSNKDNILYINKNYDFEKKKLNNNDIVKINQKFEKWKKYINIQINKINIPRDKKIILYCKSVTKATSTGGYVERGHQLLNSLNQYSKKYYYLCVDSFFGIRKKLNNIQYVTKIDNVFYISLPIKKINILMYKYNYFLIDAYNYIIKKFNVKFLHSPSFYKHSLISVICSKLNNIPHFYEVRGRTDITMFEKMDNKTKKKYSSMEKIVENTSQGIFYITEECKNFVEKTDNINKISEILPNCVDYINVPTSDQSDNNNLFNKKIKFIIGYFGSTYDYENFDLIIPTLYRLFRHYRNIGFIFGGNADYNCKIKLNKLKENYPNNVIIKSYLPKKELDLIYLKLNLFIIPRKNIVVSNIISPLKPFELLLQKVPLLMSNVKCLKNISDNGNLCKIFDIKKKDDFFNTIIDIYKNGYPNKLLEEGYKFAINNTWKTTVVTREKIYDKFV